MNIIKTYESDWLGSRPIFYNEKTSRVSNNIHEVIDYKNMEFHPEGFNNYLDFGYSVFEQTPIKHVKFLRWSSKLHVLADGSIKIEYLDDPVVPLLAHQTTEEQVLDLLKSRIKAWEQSTSGSIVVPTSGGYDSRLLNCLITDKKRTKSFTYGLSDVQSESFEVVYARELARLLGIVWEQVPLKNFYNYLKNWDDLYGPSTHAHGMYQMEFYNEIAKKVPRGSFVLSGIIGDAWAGSVNIKSIDSVSAIDALGYTHGMHADSSYSLFPLTHELKTAYFLSNRDKFERDPKWKVVEAMRFKMILLSYLMRVPEEVGFAVYAPFLDIDIATSMLCLPAERKKKRIWQRDFFRKNNVNVEDSALRVNKKNSLNLQAARKVPLVSLRTDLLCEVVDPQYVNSINKVVTRLRPNFFEAVAQGLLNLPLVGRAYKFLGYKSFEQRFINAYCAYMTLKPIENVILKRNLHNSI